MIQDVANDGVALITINGNSCYFIVNFFRPSGSSELLLYCWYAALFVVLTGLCVLCSLIQSVSWVAKLSSTGIN